MKNTFLISVLTFSLMLCGGADPAKEKEMSDYTADICKYAMLSSNTEEWNACNDKRKEFFSKFDLDADDASANKANDAMYDCLTENEK